MFTPVSIAAAASATVGPERAATAPPHLAHQAAFGSFFIGSALDLLRSEPAAAGGPADSEGTAP